jgi:putative hydrolase of the HAD superfamily
MIDVVTFDVWNTLLVHEFYDDRVKTARIARIGEALLGAGFRFSRDDLLKAYDHSEACLSDLWKNEIDVNLEGHITLFLDGLGLEASEYNKRLISEPYAQALLDFKPVLVDGAKDVLAGLKAKGYRIGLISNTGRTPGATMKLVLRDHDILQYFDSTIFSNEVGCIKPNRRIFERALSELGTQPSRAVHVGDSTLLDVYGARAAGMRAILFNKYSERFEKYAVKYYNANGRSEEPDATIGSLDDTVKAIESLEIK